MSSEEHREILTKNYAECFHCPALKYPIDYVGMNWMEKDYSGGTNLFVFYLLDLFGIIINIDFIYALFIRSIWHYKVNIIDDAYTYIGAFLYGDGGVQSLPL